MIQCLFKRANMACLALGLLLLLTSCALPQIGPLGKKGTPAATQVAGQSTTPTAGTSDAQPEKPTLPSADGISELTAKDFSDPAAGLHDLIVFTSTAKQPFPGLKFGTVSLETPERHLWALSPDRKRAGRLSPEGFGFAMLKPATPGKKMLFLQYGGAFTGSQITPVNPPEECNQSADQPYDPASPPCGGFTFSPDGRFVAYFTGPVAACGREMTVLNLSTNQPARKFPGVHWMYFLSDSTLMLSSGPCDQGKVGLYVPHTDKYAGTGGEGKLFWNPPHNTLLIQAPGKPALRSGLWGFNQKQVFLWAVDEGLIEDSPSWAPDGMTFLYQHRKASYDKEGGQVMLEGPRQIIYMNSQTRAQHLRAFAPGYDYHLCATAGEPCDQWYGDWVKVYRTPFRPTALKIDPATGLPDLNKPDVRCALYGQDCKETPEEFALNWKTGEMKPWAEAGLSEPISAFISAPPPDKTVAPIYSDPNGSFAFYTSTDGHTLWYVPQSGDPVLWVENGDDFTYLP